MLSRNVPWDAHVPWDAIQWYTYTLPTAEILGSKNARAFLVCGFLMKSFKIFSENMKKIMGSF